MLAQQNLDEKAIFNIARKVSPDARAEYLQQVCGADQALFDRVGALLNAYEVQESFLESPPVAAVPITIDQPGPECIGTFIGRYKLLEQIGEGGMGVVYVAEQTEPVRRRVAFKIIKPGMDTKQVIARFEAERQALAMMDHPNIARIYDAGTTGQSTKSQASSIKQIQSTKSKAQNAEGSPISDIGPSKLGIVCDLELGHCDFTAGRPYFVMELVRGMPITEYCDKARLSPRQRLELFVDVCQAVQHAHQKGIIHRDLKPSNVMVTTSDGRAVVKVIDFGVAKAVSGTLTRSVSEGHTVYTAFNQLVGTPLYMSPEQAELTSNDVDTRSDVYSLGVLLYELLTGTTPFDKDRLKSVGFDEMRRIIREEEPETVSARLAKTSRGGSQKTPLPSGEGAERSEAGEGVRTSPAPSPQPLAPRLSELDWIVMKSLEKDRSRRYESASSLATDIQRYLSDEPVLACPPTTMYRFQKFARKHKPALATATAIALCLILGTTVSAWQAVRATTAEAQANANEQKAVANEAQAKAATEAEAQQRQRAEANEQKAKTERDEVKALADKLAAKEQQLQRHLYASNMNLAHHAWDGGVIARVQELLDQHRPQPGEPDLRGFEWHYLHRLCHRELLTLKGHPGSDARSVAFSPDGKRIASGGRGVKVWDAQTGHELLSLETGANWNVAFSPDGKRLASVSNIWDDAKKGYAAHFVKVWDAQTGQEILSFPVEGITGNGRVWWVAYNPDGKRLATSSGEWTTPVKPNEIKIWDAQTGEELQTLKGQEGPILSLAYSPDGKRLASPGAGTIKVWDTQTGEALLTVGAMGFPAAFSPDSTRLAGTAWNRATGSAFKVWDAQSGQELLTLSFPAMSVAFSPDGKRLAGGKRDGEVQVLDAQTGQELLSLKGHTDRVSGLAFSPDGSRLASSSQDGTVKVWDAAASLEARTISGTTDKISSVTFSPDGKRLAGVVRDRATTTGAAVKVWDASSGQELLTLNEQTGRVVRVVYSPDGKRLASGGGTWDDKTARYVAGEVKVWDAQTGREIATFKAHTAAVVSVAFSPDGKRVASSSSRPGGKVPTDPLDEVKVWDAETGQQILALKGHTQFVDSVAYSPDGKRLATLSRDNTVKVWDAQTGQEILSLNVQTFLTGSVAFSPDGKRLASSNNATASGSGHSLGEVKVWDAQTGRELLSLKGLIGSIASIVFSPDGKRLVAGSGNSRLPRGGGPLKVWDAESGQELLTLQGGGYHDGISFSPDGHWLASDVGGKVTIWDATPLPEKP